MSCSSREERVYVTVNGTAQFSGCQRSPNNPDILIICLVSIFGTMALVFSACCAFTSDRNRERSKWYRKRQDERRRREDAEFVRAWMKGDPVLLEMLQAGNVTADVERVIARARAADGPLANSRFSAYYVSAASDRGDDFACIQHTKTKIVNVQPADEMIV